jgi:two-component system, chemotaxis family, chemotaxis protein CheY
MEGFGYAVGEAENGEEALAKCRAGMPDVILLDWNMPVMSGLQFVTALGEVPGPQRPTVVFCTTESDPAIVRSGIAAGAAGFVIKPFNQQTLQLALERVGAI